VPCSRCGDKWCHVYRPNPGFVISYDSFLPPLRTRRVGQSFLPSVTKVMPKSILLAWLHTYTDTKSAHIRQHCFLDGYCRDRASGNSYRHIIRAHLCSFLNRRVLGANVFFAQRLGRNEEAWQENRSRLARKLWRRLLMKDEDNNRPPKQEYARPMVTRISLHPEEAVLGNCKSLSSSGPVGGGCTSVGSCRTIGS